MLHVVQTSVSLFNWAFVATKVELHYHQNFTHCGKRTKQDNSGTLNRLLLVKSYHSKVSLYELDPDKPPFKPCDLFHNAQEKPEEAPENLLPFLANYIHYWDGKFWHWDLYTHNTIIYAIQIQLIKYKPSNLQWQNNGCATKTKKVNKVTVSTSSSYTSSGSFYIPSLTFCCSVPAIHTLPAIPAKHPHLQRVTTVTSGMKSTVSMLTTIYSLYGMSICTFLYLRYWGCFKQV